MELTEKDLDNLQWAKDFLDRYDRRRPLGSPRKPVGEFK